MAKNVSAIRGMVIASIRETTVFCVHFIIFLTASVRYNPKSLVIKDHLSLRVKNYWIR